MVFDFDQSFVAQHMLADGNGYIIRLDAYVESREDCNVFGKDVCTLERRLPIEEYELRQMHRTGQLRYLPWISGGQNVTDGFTHFESSSALEAHDIE